MKFLLNICDWARIAQSLLDDTIDDIVIMETKKKMRGSMEMGGGELNLKAFGGQDIIILGNFFSITLKKRLDMSYYPYDNDLLYKK